MVEKTRPPARIVKGEGYEITQGGVVYHPHAEEEVRFIGTPSVPFVQNALRFNQLALLAVSEGGDFIDLDQTVELARVIEAVREEFAQHIESWTWTDFKGEPLPAPSPEALLRLPLVEMFWLVGEFQARE